MNRSNQAGLNARKQYKSARLSNLHIKLALDHWKQSFAERESEVAKKTERLKQNAKSGRLVGKAVIATGKTKRSLPTGGSKSTQQILLRPSLSAKRRRRAARSRWLVFICTQMASTISSGLASLAAATCLLSISLTRLFWLTSARLRGHLVVRAGPGVGNFGKNPSNTAQHDQSSRIYSGMWQP
ncbi:hypothetical protein AUEXF2481DRAFT_28688 [Aureobasidium subglaciale EXF-2481]|uniref:Uncharacterized protein n=1 Tax=Aureobasidium subglaciale (strain EXF-2481) TaxID=1043005 RepID=A0A074YDZ1_AURSE|nr:uncharacterized protein AUEXF2481DRAFT_28688 [Aureobasidium subglaciale EXF-2481]KAI5211065.1 hypothetical protein E4T38_01588 [Aureobasidium subglaciale]KAI5219137.1 hypothetical protein E4T40_06560 [Aureobasidium subglaciale]KAI5233116.1 hypothetical protein E4T41_01586 [Aureobasidium subglaciale]KAI5260018.1 hypothetical protein E4T46_06360 [Aureobasidium subglaciale]KEQ95970.1 hypothetical protein AUEXF2481DRAFT_28688 [Aureobasidium subglaciale EXF-2481]